MSWFPPPWSFHLPRPEAAAGGSWSGNNNICLYFPALCADRRVEAASCASRQWQTEFFHMPGFPAGERQFSSLSPCMPLQLRAVGAVANEVLLPQPPSAPIPPPGHRNRLSLATHHTSTIATLILRAQLHRILRDPVARGMAISTRVSSRPNLHFRLVFSWSPAVSTAMALRNTNLSPGSLSNSRVSLD